MSLVEILVSTALLGLVGLVLTSTMIAGIRIMRGTTTRGEDTSSARQGLDRISQTMRLAIRIDGSNPAFVSAAGNDVTFYSNYNTIDLATSTGAITSGPTKVHYYVVSGAAGTSCAVGDRCLMENRVNATKVTTGGIASWTFTGTGNTRPLARGVATSSTAPLFTFLKSTSDPATHATTVAAVPVQADGSIAAVELVNIDTVRIVLSVDYQSNPDAPVVRAETQVAMPNVANPAPLT